MSDDWVDRELLNWWAQSGGTGDKAIDRHIVMTLGRPPRTPFWRRVRNWWAARVRRKA